MMSAGDIRSIWVVRAAHRLSLGVSPGDLFFSIIPLFIKSKKGLSAVLPENPECS
jgi:hypothetical protein